MDLFSNKGAMLDRQHLRMQETFEKAKNDGAIDPAEAKRIEKVWLAGPGRQKLSGGQGHRRQHHRDSRHHRCRRGP